MKKTVFILLFFSVLQIAAQKPKHYIEITIKDGLFKGTHLFVPPKGDYTSQINIKTFNGVSTLSANKLIADNGTQIHNISRGFLGDVKVGTHKTKKYTAGCGHLNFIDLQNKQPYKRVNGYFTGCSSTKITNLTSWKKGVVKSRRKVTGTFADAITFIITKDNGSKETINTEATITFVANQSKMN